MTGAYGIRLQGVAAGREWLQPVSADAPSLRLEVGVGAVDPVPSRYDRMSADLKLLGGGRLRAQRNVPVVRYVLPAVPADEDLIHPYFAPAAALFWRWAGREVLHAGAFAGEAGAVVVVGARASGKSATLAWLAAEGVAVVSDDLAVVDGNDVLAGPRGIDLRSPLAGGRERLVLPPGPDRLPLAGIAFLRWGDRLEVTETPVEQRWRELGAQRYFPALDPNPSTLLGLLAVPAVTVTRPADPDVLPAVGRRLMERFGGRHAGASAPAMLAGPNRHAG